MSSVPSIAAVSSLVVFIGSLERGQESRKSKIVNRKGEWTCPHLVDTNLSD